MHRRSPCDFNSFLVVHGCFLTHEASGRIFLSDFLVFHLDLFLLTNI